MTLVFPHLEDKNLEQWMLAPKSGSSQVQPGRVGEPHQDLAEALQRFHIASTSKSLSASFSSSSPKVLLPPILMSSNSNTWLSTRCHVKRLSSSPVQTGNSNAIEDLSKWLAVAHKKEDVDNLSQDFSKWLKKSVPAGSSLSSLPGKRVEFPDIPLSAFTHKTETASVTATSSDSNDKWLAQHLEKWLCTPTSSQMQEAMDTGDEDEEVDESTINQWLLVERTVKNEPVEPGHSSCGSIEEWLMAAASDREPSIVVISDDDDVISGFSGDFANLR